MKKLLLLVSIIMVFSPVLVVAQSEDAQSACAQAEADAEGDVNGGLWLAGGCLIGVIAVGAAYLMEPSPPASKLLNKSPEYVAVYKDCYKDKGKSIQTSNAIKGCLVGAVVSIALQAIIISAAD